MDENIGGVWRTVGGRRIFIKDGQSLEDAMQESGKFVTSKLQKYYKDKNTGKYIARIINGEYWALTDDKEKALLTKRDVEMLESSSKYLKKKNIDPEMKEETLQVPVEVDWYEKKTLQEELTAREHGFKTYGEYKKSQQEKLNKEIEKSKKTYEDSYVYKNKNARYNPYDIYFDSESTIGNNNQLYNNEVFSELIKRKAKQFMDIEETHASARKGSKFGNSIYLKDKKTGNEVRISNHELPDTAEREYNQAKFGHRWNKEIILDQTTMEEIANIKTEKEFKKYIQKMFE